MKFTYLCLLSLSLLLQKIDIATSSAVKKADISPVAIASVKKAPLTKQLKNRSKHSIVTSASLHTTSSFPAFNYPDTSGKKISLNEVKGKKATLIVFWASWCSPCRKEIPALKTFYGQYKDKGISIVSVSVDQNITAWKKAVKEEKMPWSNIANLPSDGQEIMEFFGIKSVPTMFLLDGNNQILLSDPTFEQVLAKVKTL